MSNKGPIALWLAVTTSMVVLAIAVDPHGLIDGLKKAAIVVLFLSFITNLILSIAAADWRWWKYW